MPKNSSTAQTLPHINFLKGKIWLPVSRFEQHLHTELALEAAPSAAITGSADVQQAGMLNSAPFVYSEVFPKQVFWIQLCWEEPFTAHFKSITEAAALLRSIQRNWAHYPVNCFRRAELITQRLPFISKKNKSFPYSVPLAEMGVWSLLDDHTLIASPRTSSPFPLGSITFEQDHEHPPSRAYLKLWEALTLLDFYYRKKQAEHPKPLPADWSLPHEGSRCIDAGACPGGWTWVLHNCRASIIAVDRSPLAEPLMQQPNIRFIKHDAFTLPPEELGTQDWIFSDVICYPERLYKWVEQWRMSGLCEKFVCTIKMQGEPDFETTRQFAAIPHSKIVHLTANKHELTWLHAPFI